jgi:hypothetical protein
MFTRALISASILMLFMISLPLKACEPAVFDFDLFLKKNDANADRYLQKAELLAVHDLESYGNSLDKPVNTEEAFAELDVNKDKRLAREELWAWGKYTKNTCADFDMHAEEGQKDLSFTEKLIAWLSSFF